MLLRMFISIIHLNFLINSFRSSNSFRIKNISFALSDCGANRISGASDIHQSTEIMAYLSNRDIVLDIS
jgi:hypothetical protein